MRAVSRMFYIKLLFSFKSDAMLKSNSFSTYVQTESIVEIWTWCRCSGRLSSGGAGSEQTSTWSSDRSWWRLRAAASRTTRNSLARPVFVVRVLLDVQLAQSFCLVNERLLLGLGQLSPASTQSLTDLRVVHVRPPRRDLLTLDLHAPHSRSTFIHQNSKHIDTDRLTGKPNTKQRQTENDKKAMSYSNFFSASNFAILLLSKQHLCKKVFW